ncbi:MAG: 23S rRNA (adenine(2030)-N(6))-methyltransferase RlmJ [Burkholderiaceae bacterium]
MAIRSKASYAQKKGEYEQRRRAPVGRATTCLRAARRLHGAGAPVQPATARLEQYPGSPAFAQMLLRPQDQLRLYELHPTDHRILDGLPRQGSAARRSRTCRRLRRAEEPGCRRPHAAASC